MREHVILLVFGLLILRHGLCFEERKLRIAIIGGGIGGASASHFLTELFKENLKIDLYEAKTIGGRLATVKMDNNEVEAGGSIIHPQNMYMQKFVKLLGLKHRSDNGGKWGIWNGDNFVFKSSNWNFISLTKLLYRYGWQIFKLNSHINTMLEDFRKIYDLQDAGKSFLNVTAMMSAMNTEFPKLLKMSVRDYLLHMGFTETLIDELVQATVVVNYGQDVNIHSFVGFVSLAGAGVDLWSVMGGNKEVPQHLIYRNKIVDVIPRRVTKIRNIVNDNNSRQYEITYTSKDNTDLLTSNYDIVIIATPLTYDQEFPIKFEQFPENFEFPGNYHTTYATFVKADLNSKYFGLQESLETILSCNPNKTKINSIGIVSSVHEMDKQTSKIWKIFSRKSMGTNLIHDIFSNITEKKEIIWKAYPHYSTNTYPSNFKLNDGLYYINAIEWAASAMEMSAIAGRNVAILAHNEFLQRHTVIPNGETPKDLYNKLHSTTEL